MVVKYLSKDVWGYVDHIRQAASKNYDAVKCIKDYEESIKNVGTEDTASFANGEFFKQEVIASNKIFSNISESLEELKDGLSAHIVNLVEIHNCDNDVLLPVYSILLYIEDCKDYDAMILITNQKCYLMNDDGKTIERLA